MYVRALAVMSPQRISNQLCRSNCWSFSFAFYEATNPLSCYIHLRVRIFNGVKLQNYHVLAITIYASQTSSNTYRLINKCLKSLCGNTWRTKLNAVSTDGAASMVGRVSGTVTRIVNDFNSSGFRVGCCALQLDLAVQVVTANHVKDSFQDTLNS